MKKNIIKLLIFIMMFMFIDNVNAFRVRTNGSIPFGGTNIAKDDSLNYFGTETPIEYYNPSQYYFLQNDSHYSIFCLDPEKMISMNEYTHNKTGPACGIIQALADKKVAKSDLELVVNSRKLDAVDFDETKTYTLDNMTEYMQAYKKVQDALWIYRYQTCETDLYPVSSITVTSTIENSDTNLYLDESKNMYISKKISVSVAGTDNYSITLNNAPEGTFVAATEDGEALNLNSVSSSITDIYVKYPNSALVTNTNDFNITFNVAKTVDKISKEVYIDSTEVQSLGMIKLENTQLTDSDSINMKFETGELIVAKLNRDESRIAGSKIGLFSDKDCTNSLGEDYTWISSATEDKVFSNLKAGSYYFKEIEAPIGYRSGEFEISYVCYHANVQPGKKAEVAIHNFKTILVVNKVDANEKPLAGVVFELLDSNKKSIDITDSKYSTFEIEGGELLETGKISWETADDPLMVGVNLIGLPNGTYYLIELSAPEGYELIDKEIEIVLEDFHYIEVSNDLIVPVPDTGFTGINLFLILSTIFISLGSIFIGYIALKKRQCELI